MIKYLLQKMNCILSHQYQAVEGFMFILDLIFSKVHSTGNLLRFCLFNARGKGGHFALASLNSVLNMGSKWIYISTSEMIGRCLRQFEPLLKAGPNSTQLAIKYGH